MTCIGPTATCIPCPPNTDSCAGGNIIVSAGFWRISPYSTAMLACPWPHACQGGDGSNAKAPLTTNGRRLSTALELPDTVAGCAKGYTGPLCAVCADRYFFASTTTTCEPCGKNGATQLSLLIVIPIMMFIVVIGAYITFMKFERNVVVFASVASNVEVEENDANEEEEEDAEEGKKSATAHLAGGGGTGVSNAGVVVRENIINTHRDRGRGSGWRNALNKLFSPCLFIVRSVSRCWQSARRRLKGLWKRIYSLTTIVKPIIVIGLAIMHFIVSLDQDLLMPMIKIITTVYQIVSSMPAAIDLQFPSHVTQLFNAFAFVNFTSMHFGSPQCYYNYDYIDILMLQMVAPLVIIGLIFLTYLIDHRCRTKPLERGAYVTMFLLVTYFVLPRCGFLLFVILAF